MQLLALALVPIVEGLNPFLNRAKPYSQDFEDNFNVLKYTGWEGPWSQRRSVGINRDPPAGCRVDQVTMLHRHGERYPSAHDSLRQQQLFGNITTDHPDPFVGSLEFLNWWVPYTDGDNPMAAQESLYGPYAGHLSAYWNGADYRRRYGHLYDGESIIPLFSSGYERITQTARKFGEGFFGLNYTDVCALQIIPETIDQGANTLVTLDCLAGPENSTNCPVPDPEFAKSYESGWYLPEFTIAARRLNRENKLNLTGKDVHQLMATAAFELNVRGNSPWIEVFTDEEWVAFEYFESAYYYCYFGPGSPATPYRGSLYLNATRTLLNQGPEEALPFYFSFAHDTDITPVVALLGFATQEHFDPSKVTFGNKWDITDIVPQNARLTIERLVCDNLDDYDAVDQGWADLRSEFPQAFNQTTNSSATYASNYTYPVGINSTSTRFFGNLTSNETYPEEPDVEFKTGKENIFIRVVLNEAVVPLPNCSSGPGKSCKLGEFNDLVDKAVDGNGYYDNCLVQKHADTPKNIEFFWTWNLTNENDLTANNVPYQVGLIDYQGNPANATEYDE